MAENWSPEPLVNSIPPASLLAAIDSVRQTNELIWSWEWEPSGYTINLILEDCIEHAERMHDIGLGSGEGRWFRFIRQDRRWVLIEQGRWIG